MIAAWPAARDRSPWALYLGLTLVVWGVFALDRGLWHDEVQILFRAMAAPARGEGPFPLLSSPTRRLLAWPSFLALATGRPRLVLELLAGLSWLATGLLVERLARRLWPGAERAARLAAVLTLVATPDFFTNALVALGYQLSIAAYLAAAVAGLAWLQGGAHAWLPAAALALGTSLWTSDAPAPAWLLTPLLWWLAPGAAEAAMRTRRAVMLLVWYGVGLPYVAVLVGQVGAPGTYVQRALVPLDFAQYALRLSDLAAYNFQPWRWAFARPMWLPAAGEAVPVGFRVGFAALAGAGAAFWLLERRDTARGASGTAAGDAGPGAWRPRWPGVVVALALMLACNAAFAAVQLAEFCCRTHLLSRVWAGLALAGFFDRAWARFGGVRAARVALGSAAALWIALGIAGGLERQSYFAAYARRHRQELRSVLEAVPGLAPEARLLLRVPSRPYYLASEAGYLARAWMALLYQDPGVECRVFLWSTPRATTCAPRATGLECRGELSPDCRRADGRDFELLPYDRLVFLEYVPGRNRYVLRASLPPEAWLPAAVAAGERSALRYDPSAQIAGRAVTALARDLIYGPEGPAAWLWPPGAR